MLIIEVDGNHHAEQRRYDMARDTWLESEGFSVMRFSDRDVLTNLMNVEEAVWLALTASPPPQPSPLKGEGVREVRSGRSKRSEQGAS